MALGRARGHLNIGCSPVEYAMIPWYYFSVGGRQASGGREAFPPSRRSPSRRQGREVHSTVPRTLTIPYHVKPGGPSPRKLETRPHNREVQRGSDMQG